MTRFPMMLGTAAAVGLFCTAASAHPWHRHRDAAAEAAPAAMPDSRFSLTATRRPARVADADIGDTFAPFEKLKVVTTRRDERWFYVESNGIPDHPLMVGIRAWQQQVPLPQSYTGDNAWRIPLHPVPAAVPVTTKDRFLRGAIALAVNGIPIFNPLNNRGEDASAIGELDEFGGHCGRADDYHYHVAPVHLEKVVGKGKPIAWALDGYPIYGYTEPDGSPVKNLDWMGGHEDADGNYHYHAQKRYPYLNGGFHGEVTERDGQVDPQPRARGVREALPPLRGAKIVAFAEKKHGTRLLTYEIDGRKGTVEYTVQPSGAVAFTFTDPAGRKTSETYERRDAGGDGRRDRQPSRGGGPPAGPGGRPAKPAAPNIASAAGVLAPSSSAIGPDGRLPVEFSCDGAGISPPIEWKAGPRGTKSYAVVLWHEAPDQVKSYWVVYGIPAGVTRLAKGSQGVGTVGLNDKRRPDYDPMCSKGPGMKTYHVTVYALSADPLVPAGGMTRQMLLEAMRDIKLGEGTLTFTYERGVRP